MARPYFHWHTYQKQLLDEQGSVKTVFFLMTLYGKPYVFFPLNFMDKRHQFPPPPNLTTAPPAPPPSPHLLNIFVHFITSIPEMQFCGQHVPIFCAHQLPNLWTPDPRPPPVSQICQFLDMNFL